MRETGIEGIEDVRSSEGLEVLSIIFFAQPLSLCLSLWNPATLRTVACQAPLYMGFYRQEYQIY